MSSIYNPEAQKNIDSAENKLGDAIKTLKSQPKVSSSEPVVEAIPEPNRDVDVVINASPPQKEPRRSEFVETDDPKILDRINDLYGQAKKADARNQMIIEHNKLLEAKLAEYNDKLNQIERSTKDSASNKVESDLKSALRMAREENDFDSIETIEDKLLDLRLEKRLSKTQESATPKISPPTPLQQTADKEFLRNAAYVEIISQEKDEKGNLIRGYLYDGHPDNAKAIQLFQSIPQEFAAAGKQPDIKTVMDVIDERIRGKKSSVRSSVLGGDNDDVPAKNVVRLTSAEIEVAKRMGIKPEAYARQKQLLNS